MNTAYNQDEASKYAQLSLLGEGTIYLSFRDLKQMITSSFPSQQLQKLKTVDYGCGAGRSTRFLKSIGISDVKGFDISEDMIQ